MCRPAVQSRIRLREMLRVTASGGVAGGERDLTCLSCESAPVIENIDARESPVCPQPAHAASRIDCRGQPDVAIKCAVIRIAG